MVGGFSIFPEESSRNFGERFVQFGSRIFGEVGKSRPAGKHDDPLKTHGNCPKEKGNTWGGTVAMCFG